MSNKPEIKIALYGGTKLSRDNAAFVRQLARAFLADPHVVLIGGGICDPAKRKTSVDLATYQGATSYVKDNGERIEDRLQTWLTKGKREGIERSAWGTAITLEGSPVSRRFQLVNGVNALVTIEGEGQTATALELAMALKRVALPIGFTGKDSQHFWESDRSYFERTLDLQPSLADRLSRAPAPGTSVRLAEEVATAVLRKAERRCLVLLDFDDDEHKDFFKNTVRRTVKAAGFTVHKLDEQESSGDILGLFLARLDDCHAIIADLTGLNDNVLYELGRVHHHKRVQPLILFRRPRDESKELPFYLSRYLVRWLEPDGSDAEDIIMAYLMNENQQRSLVGPLEESGGKMIG